MHKAVGAAWSTWLDEYMTAKIHAAKLYRYVSRWESVVCARALSRWEDQVAAQRKLRATASKVVTQWKHKTKGQAWSKWWGELRWRRVAKKATKRWAYRANKMLFAAWSTWKARVEKKSRLCLLGNKVCLRWQNQVLIGAWMTWCDQHVQDMITRKLTGQAVQRWMYQVEKIVLRWQNKLLAQAM